MQLGRSDATDSGEWLRGAGPESDIVISSRIRLARNLADFPFISRATPTRTAPQIEKILRERDPGHRSRDGELLYVDVSTAGEASTASSSSSGT